MPKESQKFGEMIDPKNTDRVMSPEEEKSLENEEAFLIDAYADNVERGELKMENAYDKNGKLISRIVREKDTPDGKPGRIVYFDDENTPAAADAYNKKFTPPKKLEPREN